MFATISPENTAGGVTGMYAVDEDECTGCSLCLEYCSSGAIRIQCSVAEIVQGLCTSCGSCSESCPQDAIYEYEEVPAIPGGARSLTRLSASGSKLAVAGKRPSLMSQQRAMMAAVLLPVLSKLLFRLAGRASPRGGGRDSAGLQKQRPTGISSRGGHRWRGGR